MTATGNDIERAAKMLGQSKSMTVFTGAGISKESGIPTFRDAQEGLWANYSPEDLATPQGFRKNPRTVWEWYDFRRNKVWTVKPNPGHYAIVDIEDRVTAAGYPFTLITQNIDNLHQEAGSSRVLELHGNIFRYKCLDSNHPAPFDDFKDSTDVPPRCKRCNSYIRPDVVWFGEMLPEPILTAAFEAAGETEVMLVVGTSGIVHPAASIPILAHRNGACVIEVNPEESALTPMVDIFLKGPSGIMLPELVRAMMAHIA